MVRMKRIDGVPAIGGEIAREGKFCLSIFFFAQMMSDKFSQKWIWACGVLRRVREVQDRLISRVREAFSLTELRIFKFFGKKFAEILATGCIVGKSLSQALDRFRSGFVGGKKITHS